LGLTSGGEPFGQRVKLRKFITQKYGRSRSPTVREGVGVKDEGGSRKDERKP
jgi:hypothetical protein